MKSVITKLFLIKDRSMRRVTDYMDNNVINYIWFKIRVRIDTQDHRYETCEYIKNIYNFYNDNEIN